MTDILTLGEQVHLRREDDVTFEYRYGVGGKCCTVTEVTGEAVAQADGTVVVSEHPKTNDPSSCPQ